MKPFFSFLSTGTTKRILVFFSSVFLVLLIYACLLVLTQFQTAPSHTTGRLAVLLLFFFIPIGFAWFLHRVVAFVVVVPIAIAIAVLAVSVTHLAGLMAFVIAYLFLCVVLFRIDKRESAKVINCDVEIEDAVNQKNDLEISYREKGTSISVLFEKYTSYYNLRNLATDFSSTLSLEDLCELIVQKTLELVQKGTWCLLLLSETGTGTLELKASKSTTQKEGVKSKSGDPFDFWLLRNRRSLIVTDSQKDFRFDPKKTSELSEVRSVIASPVIHEGKVIGTLRLHSPDPSCFETDELRILDAITTLASSAISNCLLFRKTQELAIRDSLTGLFVQRYFMERLGEEHRRCLISKTPLTLLMCDLDHFKVCNDRYGHGVGDMALLKTSELLRQKVPDGIVARYGGEEFSILLPKIAFEEGLKLAENIRAGVERMNLNVRRQEIPMTISIGVASVPVDTLDSEELMRVADKRLYNAKRAGRNKVCGAG